MSVCSLLECQQTDKEESKPLRKGPRINVFVQRHDLTAELNAKKSIKGQLKMAAFDAADVLLQL